mmetsp:Transcript_63530/g.182427  ORF Transcript_63530/g.182427 Transcript_63530/m.182427 type:complete len:243 (-) Transcript_63530:162-890(-)
MVSDLGHHILRRQRARHGHEDGSQQRGEGQGWQGQRREGRLGEGRLGQGLWEAGRRLQGRREAGPRRLQWMGPRRRWQPTGTPSGLRTARCRLVGRARKRGGLCYNEHAERGSVDAAQLGRQPQLSGPQHLLHVPCAVCECCYRQGRCEHQGDHGLHRGEDHDPGDRGEPGREVRNDRRQRHRRRSGLFVRRRSHRERQGLCTLGRRQGRWQGRLPRRRGRRRKGAGAGLRAGRGCARDGAR